MSQMSLSRFWWSKQNYKNNNNSEYYRGHRRPSVTGDHVTFVYRRQRRLGWGGPSGLRSGSRWEGAGGARGPVCTYSASWINPTGLDGQAQTTLPWTSLFITSSLEIGHDTGDIHCGNRQMRPSRDSPHSQLTKLRLTVSRQNPLATIHTCTILKFSF